MSFRFNGSSSTLQLSSAVVANTPLTMACDFLAFNVTQSHTLVALSANGAASSTYFRITASGDIGSDPIRCTTAGGGSTLNSSAGRFFTNRWTHACGVIAASNRRLAFCDGVAGAVNTSSRTTTGINQTNIGAFQATSGLSGVANCMIANVAIWKAALTSAEVYEIGSKRRSPLDIRPGSLVLFMPLARDPCDLRYGRVFSNTDAFLASNHPPAWEPVRKFYLFGQASAGGISGSASLTLDGMTASAAGILPISGAGQATFAMTAAGAGVLPISGSAEIALDGMTVSGAGAAAIEGEALLNLDDMTAFGENEVAGAHGDAALVLDGFGVSGAGALTIDGSGAVSLQEFAADGVGALSIAGEASLDLDGMTSQGHGGQPITGSASLTLDDMAVTAAGDDEVPTAPNQRGDRPLFGFNIGRHA